MTRLSAFGLGATFVAACLPATAASGQAGDPPPEVSTLQASPGDAEGPRNELRLTKLGADPADDAKTRLIKEMHDCAVDETDSLLVLFETGGSDQFAFAEEQLCEATDRLKNARLRLAKTDADRVAAFEASLAVRKYLETVAQARDDLGLAPPFALHQARGRRIEAEIWLLEAKEAVAAPAKTR